MWALVWLSFPKNRYLTKSNIQGLRVSVCVIHRSEQITKGGEKRTAVAYLRTVFTVFLGKLTDDQSFCRKHLLSLRRLRLSVAVQPDRVMPEAHLSSPTKALSLMTFLLTSRSHSVLHQTHLLFPRSWAQPPQQDGLRTLRPSALAAPYPCAVANQLCFSLQLYLHHLHSQWKLTHWAQQCLILITQVTDFFLGFHPI